MGRLRRVSRSAVGALISVVPVAGLLGNWAARATAETAAATVPALPPTYWLAGSDGSVYHLGSAGSFGSLRGVPLARPVVGMAATPSRRGYWLVASDGGVFAFGDARFYGSTGGTTLTRPVVAITPTPTGHGYWLAASDGGVFTFGDAPFRGSVFGTYLPGPIVAMTLAESLNPYAPGTTGYDISWPQCGSAYPPAPFQLGVVGVGGKVTFTHNPCLAGEVAWFGSVPVTLYVKLSSPAMGDPARAATGPAGTCLPDDTYCQSYNYGWNLIQDAFDYARSQGVSSAVWWLDVELPASFTGALWSTDTGANAQVVAAAIAALSSLGVQAGVYSNSYQWPLIAGTYAPDVPMWQARPNAAQSPTEGAAYCGSATFTSGPVWLVQYGTDPYDRDLAC